MNAIIKTNSAALSRWLTDIATRNLPFASALALTRTAQAAQSAVRKDLPNKFTVRRSWIVQGIQITPASKSDWPALKAVVGSRDEFMVLQETGGTRKGLGGRRIAIPTKAARPNPRAVLARSKRPGALLAKPKTFFKDTESGKGSVFQRGNGSKRVRKALFLLRPEVKVKARFGFGETVAGAFQASYGQEFEKAMDQAIKGKK